MVNNKDIDIVLLWVDGGDPFWISQFDKYASCEVGDRSLSRFREWESLKYVFRGIEKYMPWIRKIHFVTCGHIPLWLNRNCKKISIVRHDEFIDGKYLPLFNSHSIEINMHKIPGLSERFIYFNDDNFILKSFLPEDFFRKNLPCDLLSFNCIATSKIAHIKLNDIAAINRNFDKRRLLVDNFWGVFNCRYDFLNFVKSLLLLPWPKFTGFFDHHQPQAYLKSTFEQVWEVESRVLLETSKSRFRRETDVNQYLFRYWQLCSGLFYPKNFNNSYVTAVKSEEDALFISKIILSRRLRMLCINDALEVSEDFEVAKRIINDSFQAIFPDKSIF